MAGADAASPTHVVDRSIPLGSLSGVVDPPPFHHPPDMNP